MEPDDKNRHTDAVYFMKVPARGRQIPSGLKDVNVTQFCRNNHMFIGAKMYIGCGFPCSKKLDCLALMCLRFLKGPFACVGTWQGSPEPSTITQGNGAKACPKETQTHQSRTTKILTTGKSATSIPR